MTGPTIQDDIMTILMRWRVHKFVVTADIARMYRQIKMHHEDAEYQRIVWRENEDEPIKDYKLTTVTFGMTSAPFSAVKTIHKLAEDESDKFPIASAAAKRDFYVDDFFSGTETIEETINLRREITEMMMKGGFQIRKWIANDERILQGVPVEERGVENIMAVDNSSTVKTLGLQWNPKTDYFTYKTAMIAESDIRPTKREFLSTTAKIYDPIGWLAPTIILIKILYQRLWVHQIEWDEQIPEEVNQIYQKYRIEFPLLEKASIPRWINTNKSKRLELHGFCDASNNAYAAVIYTKTIDDNGNIGVSLLTSKTRVAPIQKITIPKLELSAAVLLIRLINRAKKALNRNDMKCFAWSDSTITLAWIRNNSNKLPTFVANRVSEIKAEKLTWRHVPTHVNAADCASRGLTPSELLKHELWWKGPPFLYHDKESWPEDVTCTIEEAEKNEIQTFSTFTETDKKEPHHDGSWPLKKYSSFSKLHTNCTRCTKGNIRR